MTNHILKPNGEYIKPSFTGSTGEWILVSIESIGKSTLSCLDTFKNTKSGIYKTIVRSEVFRLANEGLIM